MMRIYLDNAATSWPKPDSVYAAVDAYQRTNGAPDGRSGYRDAVEASHIVDRARRGVALLMGVLDPSRIIFGCNGTDVLNLAIRGVLRPGDHVVTTVCEHNSVLRPLRWLSETADVDVTYVPCDGRGLVSPDDVTAALRPTTRLVAVVHASNVTGALQPINDICRAARQSKALVLIDGAQSLGHVPIDVEQIGADMIAAPGHKGLLGPLGTGILYLRPRVETMLAPLRFGGTGTQSEEDRQPETLPDKYEPGNHNLPGLAGLAAACEFLRLHTVEAVHAQLSRLTARLLDGLKQMNELTVYGPPTTAERTSVVSLAVRGYDPQEFAAALDSAAGVQSRAGLHCAPRMHAALGTLESGGLVRLSLGWATTEADVDRALDAIGAIAGA